MSICVTVYLLVPVCVSDCECECEYESVEVCVHIHTYTHTNEESAFPSNCDKCIIKCSFTYEFVNINVTKHSFPYRYVNVYMNFAGNTFLQQNENTQGRVKPKIPQTCVTFLAGNSLS